MQDIELPHKKYFKIGETSSLLGIKPHVLRYWESEFPQIRPFKSKTGQRLYRRSDLESLARIQKLLYKERFTIAGARQALSLPEPNAVQQNLLNLKTKLESILESLK
ncbi:MAG: MerR family transcriptional regulator [Myxococcaceae bacterium]|nr:MerR family transcriptional regulator [Myxococcaceae bacterium]MBH2005757.1 MerR family transcriptional regulator [Myxococcaceae bacterium]